MLTALVTVVVIAVVPASREQIINLAAENPRIMLGLFNQFQQEFGKKYSPDERKMRLTYFRK